MSRGGGLADWRAATAGDARGFSGSGGSKSERLACGSLMCFLLGDVLLVVMTTSSGSLLRALLVVCAEVGAFAIVDLTSRL